MIITFYMFIVIKFLVIIFDEKYMMSSFFSILSYDVASGSEITPCNKICKPLVVYRFSGNFMTSITTLRT